MLLDFPASGNRNKTSGMFGAVGSNGNSWVSSPNGATQGYKLNFNSGNVNPLNTWYRSESLPVRCIRD